MMTAAVYGMAVVLGVYTWARRLSFWPLTAGWGLGLMLGNGYAVLSGLLTGFGLLLYWGARQYELVRNHDEQAALLFLVRLKQLVSVRGTLAGALDEMGYRSGSTAGDAGERVLAEVASEYHVNALTFVSRVAFVIRRHGGLLMPLLDWGADTIQRGQARRQSRELEEAAQRTTILVLTGAPWAVIGMFRLVVPSFYRTLAVSGIGHGTMLVVGVMNWVVFLILAQHMRGEARIR